MRMTKIKNEIKIWVFFLFCVSTTVVCVDHNLVAKVGSCINVELEPLQWDERASWICGDENLYHCVEDENGRGQMFEFCRRPVNIQPGYYPTYSDDADRIVPKPCPPGYYQARSVDSSDINRCKKWSLCEEVGQLVCKEGTRTEDTRCKCDHKKGFSILIYGDISSNKETCCPDFDTTCKCWEKSCPSGQKLNAVYQCAVILPCESGYYRPNLEDDCVPIATNRPFTTENSITPKTTLKTTVTTSTTTETTRMVTKVMLKPEDDITKNAVISACVGIFIALLIAIVVIWFCCPGVRAKLFCFDVTEEEIEEDLEPVKKFRCFLPCCYKPKPIYRASSRDFKALENPEERSKLNDCLEELNEVVYQQKKSAKRIRRISSSLMNVGETRGSPDDSPYRPRSSTLDNHDYVVSSPSTPYNYSNLNIPNQSKSPASKATSIRTNKSIKKTTKCCCRCFGWEEIKPITDTPNGLPTRQLSFDDVTSKIVNGTSPAEPDSFMEFAVNYQKAADIPLIEVTKTGSKDSVTANDDANIQPDYHEGFMTAKEDIYKYENFPELFNEKVHERIGIVTVNGLQGTGFRVGEDLIMTTYNLFGNSSGVISQIKEQIITLIDKSQPHLEIEELETTCFKAVLEQHHKFSSRIIQINRLFDIWIHNNSPGFTFTDVAKIFSEIRPSITQGITDIVKQIWDAKIQFGFQGEGESSPDLQFDIDSDIPFYSDRQNIIILKLIRKPDILVPPRFYLSIESDIEVGMHLLGHPDSSSLKIDPSCHIYMGDNWKKDLQSDTEKAYKWVEKCDFINNEQTEILQNLETQYITLQKGDDMIFNCSQPNFHDASGCCGIVMNKSWPELFKIQTMLLTGHPQELQELVKHFDPKKEKVKLFYEKGVTMKAVYRLLSNSKIIHLRDELFAKFEDVNKDQTNNETKEKKKKKKKTKHIHKHEHYVFVQGAHSTVAVGDHTTIIHQGQDNSEGQSQVNEVKGRSDMEEEELSDSKNNTDSDVSGTNGDTEGNSDDSSGESFQGFKTSNNSKSETAEQKKAETTKGSKQKSDINQPKKASTNSDTHRNCDEKEDIFSQINHSGHTKSSNDTQKILMETLKEQGMRVRGSIPKDGNCFFHAVVDQLKRLDMPQQNLNHLQLRSQVVWYLKNLPKEQLKDVEECVEGSLDDYLLRMERDGEFADHVIIEFTAKYLQREILIVTSSPQSKNAKRENIIINTEDAKNGCQLLLGHVYENHYESLEMKDEAELES